MKLLHLVDESTDISCEPHLIIYIKYCLRGNIKINFLKLLKLKNKDSKSIFELIIGLFDEKGELLTCCYIVLFNLN